MDYTALRDGLVVTMLTRYGKPVTRRRIVPAIGYTKSFNIAEQRFQWEDNVTHVVTFADPGDSTDLLSGSAVERPYEVQEVDGVNVMAGDRRFVTADVRDIGRDDTLFVNGVDELHVVAVKEVAPGPTTIVVIIQCRE